MTIRVAVYRLIEDLSEAELETVYAFLARLRRSSLPTVLATAAWDDEPETEAERAAMAESDDDLRQGRVHEAVVGLEQQLSLRLRE